MNDFQKIEEAGKYLISKLDFVPDIAVILGSGLGSLAEEIENPKIIKYSDIPHFPVSTVAGHAGQFVCGILNSKKVIMMQGRFHYYEGYTTKQVTLPVRVLNYIGVKTLIVTNAAGGVNTSFKPGELMVITDHISFGAPSPLIGSNMEHFGPRFPDMSEPYDKELAAAAFKAAEQTGISISKGTYFMMSGPNYETPAEIRMVRKLGADAVGMSTVPEVIAAKHSSMKVLGISCITNMAAGILDQPLNHLEVIETSNRVKDKFIRLVKQIIINI